MALRLVPVRYVAIGLNPIDAEIVAVKFRFNEPIGWAVRIFGYCLNKSGKWEFEPSPSNRSDAFIERTRWATAEEAAAALEAADG
jgi:hypothetical protein